METVTEKVLDLSSGDIPTKLTDFIAKLSEALDAVPPDYRDTAEVDLDPSYSYGDAYANVVVTYERPKEPAEFDAERQEEVRRTVGFLRRAEREVEVMRERLEKLRARA